jgi:ABC-2 type transport system permease protein
MGRGVIDLRDVIYFLSLAGIFLALAYGALLSRKLAPATGTRARLRLGVAMLATSLVVVNLLGSYIGGRLDLTPGQAYTLSPATREIARNLDDLVTVKVFASKELPTEVALMKRDLDDLLHDLRSAGNGRIRVVERDPAEDPAAKRREIESRLEALASPFRTAEATGQDIIDPRETRQLLCEFVEDAQRVIRTQLGPTGFPYRP